METKKCAKHYHCDDCEYECGKVYDETLMLCKKHKHTSNKDIKERQPYEGYDKLKGIITPLVGDDRHTDDYRRGMKSVLGFIEMLEEEGTHNES